MKLSTAIFIFLAISSACAAKKKPPLDDSIAKRGNFKCFDCLRRHAPQCIPPCFPNPLNKKCVTCLVTAAVECLEDCSLPKIAEKIDPVLKDTCEAKPDYQGNCVVSQDNCDAGAIAVPSKFPILKEEICFCSCDTALDVSNDIFINNSLEDPVEGCVNVNFGLGVVSCSSYSIDAMGNTTVFAPGQRINITATTIGEFSIVCSALDKPSGNSFQVESSEGLGGCRVVPIQQNSVETGLIFEENGETYEQKDSYNPDTKEAVFTVPAHGDYPATKFVMQGRSSDSPVAGKMIVSTETECSFEDMPEEIVPENMMIENRGGKVTRQTKEVKVYRIRSEIRSVTEEEKENLSESMKSECAGKRVVTSSIETVDEDEYLKRSNFSYNFIRSLKRVDTDEMLQKGPNCKIKYYGCANTRISNCVRWNYEGHPPFGQPQGQQPLIVNVTLHFLTSENYCTNCCHEQENTVFPVCSCITDEQRFSTAFAISRQRDGCTEPDCIKRSKYCKWDPDTTIQDCHYTTRGACVWDSSCPMGVDTQPECG